MRAAVVAALLAATGGLAWVLLRRPAPVPAVPAASGAAGAPGGTAAEEWAGIEPVVVTVERMAEFVSNVLMPRGMRNNNPGNLRWISDPARRWNGMSGQDASGYAIFDSLRLGARALAKQLLAYEARGINTVTRIVSTWAPDVENDTAAYIRAVSAGLGVGPDQPVSVRGQLASWVRLVSRHELGRRADGSDWLTDDDVRQAVMDALA